MKKVCTQRRAAVVGSSIWMDSINSWMGKIKGLGGNLERKGKKGMKNSQLSRFYPLYHLKMDKAQRKTYIFIRARQWIHLKTMDGKTTVRGQGEIKSKLQLKWKPIKDLEICVRSDPGYDSITNKVIQVVYYLAKFQISHPPPHLICKKGRTNCILPTTSKALAYQLEVQSFPFIV